MNHRMIRTIDTSTDEEKYATQGATITTAGDTRPALVGLIHWEVIDAERREADSDTHLLTPGQARELAQALIDAAYAVDEQAVTLSTYVPTTGDLASLTLAFDAAEKAGLGVCVGNGFQAHEGKYDQAADFIEAWLFGSDTQAA